MSKKVIDAVWKQKHIEVYTKMLELPDMDRYPSYDELHVLIDGVEPDSFGETFPGYKIAADDMFMKLISAYVSNETYITFNEVDEQIIKLKNINSLGLAAETGRSIPDAIYNSMFTKLDCMICYTVDDTEYALYCGGNDEVALVLTSTGELISDIDDMVVGSIVDDFENKDVIVQFHDKSFEETLLNYGIKIA